jgi:hypothetical protein
MVEVRIYTECLLTTCNVDAPNSFKGPSCEYLDDYKGRDGNDKDGANLKSHFYCCKILNQDLDTIKKLNCPYKGKSYQQIKTYNYENVTLEE